VTEHLLSFGAVLSVFAALWLVLRAAGGVLAWWADLSEGDDRE
jgi:hypothetical protein